MSNAKSRGFHFTWNNYTEANEAQLKGLPTRYIIYGYETAPSTGTPHLQGHLYFNHPRSLTALRGLLAGCDLRTARGDSLANADYCSKECNYYESGVRPTSSREKGVKEKERWTTAIKSAKRGLLEEIEEAAPDIYLRHYHTLKRIRQDFMVKPADLQSTCGIWIRGDTNAGKTHAATTAYPDAYRKPRNKWWDGYQEEEVVILDDVDLNDSWCGSFLKHWADRYSFVAEIKGGSRAIRPAKLIVTSQYKIEDIWHSDKALCDAIKRRFVVIEKTRDQNIII